MKDERGRMNGGLCSAGDLTTAQLEEQPAGSGRLRVNG